VYYLPVKLSTGDGTKVQDADPIKKDSLLSFSPVDGRAPGLAFVFYGSFQNFTVGFCQKAGWPPKYKLPWPRTSNGSCPGSTIRAYKWEATFYQNFEI